ncbi:hypothetical protein J2D73_16760 [Acetobacter sacchari]|uniref:Uncharacterized protein n=1 Tax=Acetobacter sacchari TaxID=2661687 RepID=A0ABS3LZT6_9PROT|nr:hypothetical protein [Acetobacter sacchari]MBO1361438.1 hypothetical protein [Acetobacter sacchari]
MSKHRSRITLLSPSPRALEIISWTNPPGASALGYIQRGDDQGRLLRLASGALVIQLPGGSIGTLDQRKAQAMLDAADAA